MTWRLTCLIDVSAAQLARFPVQTENYKYRPRFFNTSLTPMSRVEAHICIKEAGVKSTMPEYTKINFNYRKDVADYSDLVEMLFPGNRNQQHAAACVLFELKWSESIVKPSLNFIQDKYTVSKRILERTRSKLSRLGLIEHVSSFNSRYGGQSGWKLSSRFEASLKKLAEKTASLRDKNSSSKEKNEMFVSLTDARRSTVSGADYNNRGDLE